MSVITPLIKQNKARLLWVLLLLSYFMCVTILLACVYVHQCTCLESEEGIKPPGTEVIRACEPACGCWELNPRPQEEPQMLFNRSCHSGPFSSPQLWDHAQPLELGAKQKEKYLLSLSSPVSVSHGSNRNRWCAQEKCMPQRKEPRAQE